MARDGIEPRVRDCKRVFLMTSSESRGVSVPLATTIIALVPRFAMESGFMEVAQLVCRGRSVSVRRLGSTEICWLFAWCFSCRILSWRTTRSTRGRAGRPRTARGSPAVGFHGSESCQTTNAWVTYRLSLARRACTTRLLTQHRWHLLCHGPDLHVPSGGSAGGMSRP